MTYKTIARRIQTQTDEGVLAGTPEMAAGLVAAGQSNGTRTTHSLGYFSEIEVLDETGKVLGTFQFDENHRQVKKRPVVAPPDFVGTAPEKSTSGITRPAPKAPEKLPPENSAPAQSPKEPGVKATPTLPIAVKEIKDENK